MRLNEGTRSSVDKTAGGPRTPLWERPGWWILTSVVLATVLTGLAGLGVGPLIMVGVFVAFLVPTRIHPRPAREPEPAPTADG